MKKIHSIKGLCVPMGMDDIDTDIIIPAQYLTQTTQAGYGQYAFNRLKQADPNFVLNQSRFKQASILISGANFGCGSSREHAVWAIQELGIQAIIAESFADIFRNNAQKNKLVLIEQPEFTCKQLIKAAESGPLNLSIHIKDASIHIKNRVLHFPINPFFQHCLLQGMDEMDYLVQRLSDIETFKQQQNNNTLFIESP